MRIERIRVDAFGRLHDLDTGRQSLGDLVVVLGPNEAGKSTLFAFLTTALYGFLPASRERNPHVPWGADEAAGGIVLSVGDGGCAEVERRLRSSPSGRISRSGATTELRNLPLPWVEHVPRAVFRQVFAVTLAELAGLDDETWARIQDRIVGAMGSSDLRPVRVVAEELEREAAEIWRPNRRGNQRLRALQEEARAARGRRLAALERDREIRALVEERENVRVRLRELREERQRHRLEIDRIQSLLPLRRQLAHIDALRARGGTRAELRGLPEDPRSALSGLEAERGRLDRRLAGLDEELRAPEEALARLDETVRGVLERAPEIARFLSTAAEVGADRRRARALEAELAELDVHLRTAADHLLTGGWRQDLEPAVSRVSLALLEDRVERLEHERLAVGAHGEGRQEVSGDRDGGRARGTLPHPIVAGAAVAVGLALLFWSARAASTLVAALVAGLGAALATVGALALLQRLRAHAQRPTPTASGSEASTARLETEIAHMLRDLPVRPDYLQPPGTPLVAGLRRLQALVVDRRERLRALDVARAGVASADEAAGELALLLGRNGAPDAEGLAATVERELRDAERIRAAAEQAEREHARILRAREECVAEITHVRSRIETMETALARLGDGDPGRGARDATARLQAHARADRLHEELERSHPDLQELRARIAAAERAGDGWTMDDADLARRKAHVEELDATIEQLSARVEALELKAAHLREEETVDAVDGEISSLQEKEAALVRERDRKWVLAQLVREADRRFREEHQPDLLRRASAHLAHLTRGRYDRLLVDESGVQALFQILGPALPAPIPLAAPVSTGTLEQAYLSLRLAIVDHLDQGHEKLPLFIDEVFVNWDRDRRERGLEVLSELAAERQLFVFTCHPDTAARLEALGGRVLRLG